MVQVALLFVAALVTIYVALALDRAYMRWQLGECCPCEAAPP